MANVDRILIVPAGAVGDVAGVLASELRLRMLALLYHKRMNINEISRALKIPQSTCATNILMLERVGLVQTQQIPAERGSQKVCTSLCEEVVMTLVPDESKQADNVIETEMPVGLYTDFEVATPCGLLSQSAVIGYFDHPNSFLDPHRATAQLLWFARGYVEYRFPKNVPAGHLIKGVSITCELCSEFPGSNPDWPSDISLWINGIEIGTWTSPGDMGDKRGLLTPDWWRVGDSQYGFLKTWKITEEESFVDGVPCSGVRVSDLGLDDNQHLTVRFGIKDDAENRGGLNLFGRGFGNYEKDIVLRLEVERPDGA